MLGNELDLQVADEVSTWINRFGGRRLEEADVVTFVKEAHQVLTCRKAEGGVAVQNRGGFGIDLFVDGQDGNVGVVTVVFRAIRTAWLVVVGVEDSFFDKQQGVDLIAEFAGDGEEGGWDSQRDSWSGAHVGFAACCVSSCDGLQHGMDAYDGSVVLSMVLPIALSTVVRGAEDGDGKVRRVCLRRVCLRVYDLLRLARQVQ